MKKPTKLDMLAASTACDYKDESTNDVNRRRATLKYDNVLLDGHITTLQMKLTDARAAKARNEAELRGLMAIVEKR